MVGKWYPDNKGARTGFVNGGFAYGTLPLIFVFNYWFHPSNYKMVLDLIALGMVLVVAFCGMFFRDPPKSWWPHDVDPLNRGVSEDARRVAKRLAKNPPAKGQFTPMEAIRTGQLPLMWFALVCIGGVSLFGINFQVPFAKSLGFGPLVAASSAGVLAVVNGVGRAIVGWLSDYLGLPSDPRPGTCGGGTGAVRRAVVGPGAQRTPVPVLRVPQRLRRRGVLPAVRRAHPGLLR